MLPIPKVILSFSYQIVLIFELSLRLHLSFAFHCSNIFYFNLLGYWPIDDFTLMSLSSLFQMNFFFIHFLTVIQPYYFTLRHTKLFLLLQEHHIKKFWYE
jgi:hypothetical protein